MDSHRKYLLTHMDFNMDIYFLATQAPRDR